MRKIFALLGKACTGKDTITSIVSETLELPVALSFTTRPMRKGEKQGVQYNFISDADFWILHGCDLLAEYVSYEVASGETWHYGLTKDELEKDKYVLVIVNPLGLNRLKELYGEKICSILIDAPADVRIKRYLNRDNMTEEKAEECCRRFLADNKDFRSVKTDYKVENAGDLKKVCNSLEKIIRLERAKDLVKETNELFKKDKEKFLWNLN